MHLSLRLFADCASDDEAHRVHHRLEATLAPWAPRADAPASPYWKIPEHFGFQYHLTPATPESYDAIRRLATGAWHSSETDGEWVSIYNRQPDTRFLEPAVAWAELCLHGPALAERSTSDTPPQATS